AGHDHREVERLGQVVVSTYAKPTHQVLHRRRRGEHEHPAAASGGNQLGAYVVAVQAGQVSVEHDHVVVVEQGPLKPGRAVERDVDGHPRLAQPGGDRLGHLLIVFDHKYPHRHSLPTPGPPQPGRSSLAGAGANSPASRMPRPAVSARFRPAMAWAEPGAGAPAWSAAGENPAPRNGYRPETAVAIQQDLQAQTGRR